MRKRRLKQIIWYIAKLMDHHKVKIVIVKLRAKKIENSAKTFSTEHVRKVLEWDFILILLL